MKTVNKLTTIGKAFLGIDTVSDEIQGYRLLKCKSCKYNSANIKDFDLDYVGKLRKKILKDKSFCTLCGCQIKEKTNQPTSECPAFNWGSLIVDFFADKRLKLYNLTPFFGEFDVISGYNGIDLGKISRNVNVELKLKILNFDKFDIEYIETSCGSCVNSKIDNDIIVVNLYANELSIGTFKKAIYIKGKIKNKEIKEVLILKGEVI